MSILYTAHILQFRFAVLSKKQSGSQRFIHGKNEKNYAKIFKSLARYK